MAPFALALLLFLQGQPAVAEAPPPEAAAQPPAAQPPAAQPPAPEAAAPEAAAAAPAEAPPEEAPFPAGAPRDDYQFVAWCYGSLRGYLDLHDLVMPEVTRIESTYRPPDRKLSDDLKVYADMQKAGRAQLKIFLAAMTAAEKASLRPLNTIGAQAVQKGHAIWQAGPGVTKARMAQEWMSWALPARCETTAKALEDRATLMGASFKVNDEPDPKPADAAAPPAPADAPPAPPVEAAPPSPETPSPTPN